MRPLGTQRPERPKSELWQKKYEKYGLNKACDAGCVCAGDRRHPCDARKSRQSTRPWGDREFPTIRSVAALEYVACIDSPEYVACIDSPQGLGALVRSGTSNGSRRGRGGKSAEIPGAVRCYDRSQASMPTRGKP